MKTARFFIIIVALLLLLPSCSRASSSDANLWDDEINDADWERTPMIMYDGELFFSRGRLESHMDAMQQVGRIEDTVSRTKCPAKHLQSNCGYVGCTVFVDPEQPGEIYVLDGELYLIFER